MTTAENFYLTVLWVGLSIGFLFLLNYIWPSHRRRAHNDVIGWQVSILGMIYAVMIGFMLYAVWANFQTADTNVDNEANALANLYEVANGLPAADRDEIHQLARKYASVVITREWPAMSHLQLASAGASTVQQFWDILSHASIHSAAEQVSLRQAMSELSDLSEHRRVRRLEARTKMPTILWSVLVIGGIVTVATACLIGSENIRLHFTLILSLSLLISLALVTIGDIDQPFQGSVHVDPTAFIRAESIMQNPGTILNRD